MELFWRTIKSLSFNEKILAGILIISVILNSYFIFFSSSNIIGIASKEKSYTEAIVGKILHLNPVYTELSDADSDISSLIFSGLVKYNPITRKFDEDLATHTLSEDKLVYTFTLKNGIYWHDGVEMTADDIYFTYAQVIQSEEFQNPILKADFHGVKVEKIDSRTVSFTLNTPNSFFYSELTVGILPKHMLENVAIADLDENEFNKNPIGTGPYKVEGPYQNQEDGTTIVLLSINENYYDNKPQIDNIRFIAYQNIEELMKNRTVWHAASRIRESTLGTVDLEELTQYMYNLPQYTAIFINTDSKILGKNKVRVGISKAIDKSEILRAINYKIQIDTPLLELNQEEWIHNYDISEAQGALFDSDWKISEGSSIRQNADGEKLSLKLVRRDFLNSNPTQEETLAMTADLIQKQLEEIGVELLVEKYEEEELNEKIVNRDYDLLLYGQSLGYNMDIFSFWHSSQADKGGLNFSNYRNPKVDYLIENIRSTFDDTEKQKQLTDLASVISDDVPAIFLYTPTYYYLVDVRILGINVDNILLPKDRFANIADWVIE